MNNYMPHHHHPQHHHHHANTATSSSSSSSFMSPSPTTAEDKEDLSSSTPRKRTRATPEQLSVLEKTFNVNPSPNNRVREQLSRELGMSERSIQIWFQNRRAKVKNIAKKSSMLHDETLRMQYYASSAAAAACQAAAYHQQQQQGKEQVDIGDPVKKNPDLYYYYYYYYFNQQQQLQQQRQKHMYHPYGNGQHSSHYSSSAPASSSSGSSSVPPPPISLKSMPPPPPPPPTTAGSSFDENGGSVSPSTATSDMTNQHSLWSKKQVHQHRARAHTIGHYYPSMMQQHHHQLQEKSKLFDRGTSAELSSNKNMIPPPPPFEAAAAAAAAGEENNYTNMLNNNNLSSSTSPTSQQQQQQFGNLSVQDGHHTSFLPYQSAPPSFFDGHQQQLAWADLPFYEDPTLMITPSTHSMFNTATTTNNNNNNTPPTTTTLLQQPYFEHNHLHQQKISAEALQIGTWKRMGFEPNDLVCQFDKRRKLFSWCIQDGSNRFKMEFGQASVSKLQLKPLEGRAGWARLELSLSSAEQINFYMEVTPGTENWVQCRDYTEDKQASSVMMHQLDGPALALKGELDLLKKENQLLASVISVV